MAYSNSSISVAKSTLNTLKDALYISPVDSLPAEYVKPITSFSHQYVERSEFLGKISPATGESSESTGSLLTMDFDLIYNKVANAVVYALGHADELDFTVKPTVKSLEKLTSIRNPHVWLLLTTEQERMAIKAFQTLREIAPTSFYYDDVFSIIYTFLSTRLKKEFTKRFGEMAKATGDSEEISLAFITRFTQSIIDFDLDRFPGKGFSSRFLSHCVSAWASQDVRLCGVNSMSAALTRRQHSVYLRMLAEVPDWETMTAREIANALGCQITTADVIQRFGWSFLTCKQQDAEQGIERSIHDTANVVKTVQLSPDYCSQPTPAYGGAISNDGGMDDALLMIALEQSLTPEQYAIVKGYLNGDYMKNVAEKLGISKSAMKYQTRTLAVRLARALGYTMS